MVLVTHFPASHREWKDLALVLARSLAATTTDSEQRVSASQETPERLFLPVRPHLTHAEWGAVPQGRNGRLHPPVAFTFLELTRLSVD